MSYKIEIDPSIQGCVYKLWYAGKFVIIKGKTMRRSAKTVEDDIERFLKETPKGQRESNRYYDFYVHIEGCPGQSFTHEMLFKSESPYELLKAEQLALEAAYGNPDCLNRDFEAYVPKYTQATTGRNKGKSWINKGYYLNFMQWNKRRQ